MSTIKFVYRSQNIPDTVPVKGSQKTITSGAVYKAINEIQMDTLFATGYLPEGIAQIVPPHKLTFADGTLTLKGGSKQYIPNGFDEEGEFLFEEVEVAEDVNQTDSFSGNMDAFVFYNADENKLVCRTKRSNNKHSVTGEILDSTSQFVFAQLNQPVVATTSSSDGAIWWDLTNNVIKVYETASDTWVQVRYAIPCGIVGCKENKISELLQVYEVAGICCDVTWVNPGTTFVIPTGRKEENGVFANKMLETTDVIARVLFNSELKPFEDLALYLSADGDIVGPVDEMGFDSVKGVFVGDNGEEFHVCRYALLSAGHLTSSALDKLTALEFTERPCLYLADNDDIEYVIRLIGSSFGLTIDDLSAALEEARIDRERIRQEMDQAIIEAKAEVEANMNDLMVHKKLPDGYNPDDVLSTMSLNETIPGVKTFTETIVGNITGYCSNVNIIETGEEIIPLGLTERGTDNGTQIKYLDTNVRIGVDYVIAEEFRGTSIQTRWADLAEIYETDEQYPIGTLLKWGGEKELTIAKGIANAVVSEAAGLLMNANGNGQPVAIAGRVKVRVVGPVKKHDAIVLHEMKEGIGKVQENVSEPIVARALEDNDEAGEKLVLCVVRFTL